MTGLTDHQRSVLGGVFAAAPDSTVRRLEQALAADAGQGGALAEVHGLIAREASDRRVRATVLGPVIPLCRPSDVGDMRFPAAVIPRLWAALHAVAPTAVAAAEAACCGLEETPLAPVDIYNQLCAQAADGLRDRAPAFAAAIEALDGAGPQALAAFVDYLDLVPLAREAATQLPQWLGRMSQERAASARLTYKDAVALSDDAGPRLVEMLLARLPEPWLILRVLAAMVIRANDRYLASSELARFGEYILSDIDRRLAAFRAFDPEQGRQAGVAAAEHLGVAASAVAEFENALELSRDGPWGARVARSKQLLAELAEARLAQIDKALDQALPLQMVRFGKGLRGVPKLVADPDPRALRRAEGLMGFFDRSRASATTSGFGAARAKVGEKVEARLDQYVEDLLEDLRGPEPQALDRVHAYLEAAAGLIGDACGEKAAQIVRRRAAAA
ncbi:MAG: hypothetical protein P4L73_16460 [Caulobacteraceae bacterium]|nr:hypothetical protein [Caulobacteraceae bacterium]